MKPITRADFPPVRGFVRALSAINKIRESYGKRDVSAVLSPNDDMTHSLDPELLHYQSIGAGVIDLVLSAMLLARKTSINSILDMPCGFGRVTRHFAAAFPDARLYACDLYDDRIEFCAEKFGATPIKSHENFDKVNFPEKFDLIFCGSLLSHLPEPEFRAALKLFSNSLADGGIAIITTLGRYSPYVQKNMFEYLPQNIYQDSAIEENFRARGFGYADYKQREVFFEQEAYGIAFASPSFIMKCLEDDESIVVCGFSERAFDDQQDALIIQKRPINTKIELDRSC